MNRDVEGQWPQAGTLAGLGGGNGNDNLNDFVNFDNFENLDFAFDIDTNVADAAQVPSSQHALANGTDGANGAHGEGSWRSPEGGMNYGQGVHEYGGDGHGHLMGSFHSAPNLLHKASMDQMIVNNDGYQQRHQIPPTPNSSGFYAQNGQMSRNFSDIAKQNGGRFQFPPDQTFTPLFTPDSTAPQSAVSYVPEYAIPPSYNLSPLTSPAMFAQHQREGYPLHHARTADSSLAASPVDATFGEGVSGPDGGDERPRKTRKKDGTSAATTPTTRPRQPAKGMASRRRGSLTLPPNIKLPRKAPSEPQSAIEFRPSGLHTAPHSPHGSTNPSVSPQPLTESLMAPPPKPVTPAGTPKVFAQDKQSHKQGEAPPATPASLMKMPQQRGAAGQKSAGPEQSVGSASPADGSMEFLSLPEAAAPVPPQESKPAGQAATPKALLPSSGRSKSESGTASPSLNGIKSPVGTGNGVKPEGASGRASKKRNSTSSNLISPALRPKISPSIRPMLPAGSSSLTPSAQELLLASKSNYQNLLEGNAVPGVNYPSELATNLTSKRTSHKIAEQGRRNRINTALQEMQSLLPSPMSAAAEKDEPFEPKSPVINGKGSPPAANGEKKASPSGGRQPGSNAHGGNSKAATVELAIEYIKQLKNENEGKDVEIERLKAQMARLQAVNSRDAEMDAIDTIDENSATT